MDKKSINNLENIIDKDQLFETAFEIVNSDSNLEITESDVFKIIEYLSNKVDEKTINELLITFKDHFYILNEIERSDLSTYSIYLLLSQATQNNFIKNVTKKNILNILYALKLFEEREEKSEEKIIIVLKLLLENDHILSEEEIFNLVEDKFGIKQFIFNFNYEQKIIATNSEIKSTFDKFSSLLFLSDIEVSKELIKFINGDIIDYNSLLEKNQSNERKIKAVVSTLLSLNLNHEINTDLNIFNEYTSEEINLLIERNSELLNKFIDDNELLFLVKTLEDRIRFFKINNNLSFEINQIILNGINSKNDFRKVMEEIDKALSDRIQISLVYPDTRNDKLINSNYSINFQTKSSEVLKIIVSFFKNSFLTLNLGEERSGFDIRLLSSRTINSLVLVINDAIILNTKNMISESIRDRDYFVSEINNDPRNLFVFNENYTVKNIKIDLNFSKAELVIDFFGSEMYFNEKINIVDHKYYLLNDKRNSHLSELDKMDATKSFKEKYSVKLLQTNDLQELDYIQKEIFIEYDRDIKTKLRDLAIYDLYDNSIFLSKNQFNSIKWELDEISFSKNNFVNKINEIKNNISECSYFEKLKSNAVVEIFSSNQNHFDKLKHLANAIKTDDETTLSNILSYHNKTANFELTELEITSFLAVISEEIKSLFIDDNSFSIENLKEKFKILSKGEFISLSNSILNDALALKILESINEFSMKKFNQEVECFDEFFKLYENSLDELPSSFAESIKNPNSIEKIIIDNTYLSTDVAKNYASNINYNNFKSIKSLIKYIENIEINKLIISKSLSIFSTILDNKQSEYIELIKSIVSEKELFDFFEYVYYYFSESKFLNIFTELVSSGEKSIISFIEKNTSNINSSVFELSNFENAKDKIIKKNPSINSNDIYNRKIVSSKSYRDLYKNFFNISYDILLSEKKYDLLFNLATDKDSFDINSFTPTSLTGDIVSDISEINNFSKSKINEYIFNYFCNKATENAELDYSEVKIQFVSGRININELIESFILSISANKNELIRSSCIEKIKKLDSISSKEYINQLNEISEYSRVKSFRFLSNKIIDNAITESTISSLNKRYSQYFASIEDAKEEIRVAQFNNHVAKAEEYISEKYSNGLDVKITSKIRDLFNSGKNDSHDNEISDAISVNEINHIKGKVFGKKLTYVINSDILDLNQFFSQLDLHGRYLQYISFDQLIFDIWSSNQNEISTFIQIRKNNEFEVVSLEVKIEKSLEVIKENSIRSLCDYKFLSASQISKAHNLLSNAENEEILADIIQNFSTINGYIYSIENSISKSNFMVDELIDMHERFLSSTNYKKISQDYKKIELVKISNEKIENIRKKESDEDVISNYRARLLSADNLNDYIEIQDKISVEVELKYSKIILEKKISKVFLWLSVDEISAANIKLNEATSIDDLVQLESFLTEINSLEKLKNLKEKYLVEIDLLENITQEERNVIKSNIDNLDEQNLINFYSKIILKDELIEEKNQFIAYLKTKSKNINIIEIINNMQSIKFNELNSFIFDTKRKLHYFDAVITLIDSILSNPVYSVFKSNIKSDKKILKENFSNLDIIELINKYNNIILDFSNAKRYFAEKMELLSEHWNNNDRLIEEINSSEIISSSNSIIKFSLIKNNNSEYKKTLINKVLFEENFSNKFKFIYANNISNVNEIRKDQFIEIEKDIALILDYIITIKGKINASNLDGNQKDIYLLRLDNCLTVKELSKFESKFDNRELIKVKEELSSINISLTTKIFLGAKDKFYYHNKIDSIENLIEINEIKEEFKNLDNLNFMKQIMFELVRNTRIPNDAKKIYLIEIKTMSSIDSVNKLLSEIPISEIINSNFTKTLDSFAEEDKEILEKFIDDKKLSGLDTILNFYGLSLIIKNKSELQKISLWDSGFSSLKKYITGEFNIDKFNNYFEEYQRIKELGDSKIKTIDEISRYDLDDNVEKSLIKEIIQSTNNDEILSIKNNALFQFNEQELEKLFSNEYQISKLKGNNLDIFNFIFTNMNINLLSKINVCENKDSFEITLNGNTFSTANKIVKENPLGERILKSISEFEKLNLSSSQIHSLKNKLYTIKNDIEISNIREFAFSFESIINSIINKIITNPKIKKAQQQKLISYFFNLMPSFNSNSISDISEEFDIFTKETLFEIEKYKSKIIDYCAENSELNDSELKKYFVFKLDGVIDVTSAQKVFFEFFNEFKDFNKSIGEEKTIKKILRLFMLDETTFAESISNYSETSNYDVLSNKYMNLHNLELYKLIAEKNIIKLFTLNDKQREDYFQNIMESSDEADLINLIQHYTIIHTNNLSRINKQTIVEMLSLISNKYNIELKEDINKKLDMIVKEELMNSIRESLSNHIEIISSLKNWNVKLNSTKLLFEKIEKVDDYHDLIKIFEKHIEVHISSNELVEIKNNIPKEIFEDYINTLNFENNIVKRHDALITLKSLDIFNKIKNNSENTSINFNNTNTEELIIHNIREKIIKKIIGPFIYIESINDEDVEISISINDYKMNLIIKKD